MAAMVVSPRVMRGDLFQGDYCLSCINREKPENDFVNSNIDSLVVNDYLLFGVELVEKFHLRRPLLCTDTRLFRLNLSDLDQA